MFDNGKFSFQQQTLPVLEAMTAILNEYPSAKFVVEGYTDNTGKVKANEILSENRAKAVVDYLIEKGINSERLTSIGYGVKNPIASNKTKAGRAQNRRVVVVLAK